MDAWNAIVPPGAPLRHVRTMTPLLLFCAIASAWERVWLGVAIAGAGFLYGAISWVHLSRSTRNENRPHSDL